jgi:anaerobic ribonucleoside-triphosphate reductase activating protein
MRIANTVNDSIVDGPGLRFAVFTQGCPHACPGCHNPETHDPAGGEEVPVEDLVHRLEKNPLIEGLTLSGGEPFLQAEDCARLARAARALGLTVWTYTGFLYERLRTAGRPDWDALLADTDILVDGPYVEAERSYGLPFRGSRNQRLIDVPKSRVAGRVVLWEREDSLGQFAVPES